MEANISETIEKLKCDKRIRVQKLFELSNAFKNTIARMEKEFDKRFKSYEKKLEVLENKGDERYASIDDKNDHLSCDMKNSRRMK